MWTATKCGARSGSRFLVRTAAGMAVNHDAAVLSVPPESTLRDKARDAIRNGTLPTRTPDRITGGPGRGEACSVCGESIGYYQIALELEFTRPGGVDKYPLHPRCCVAWESERAHGDGHS